MHELQFTQLQFTQWDASISAKNLSARIFSGELFVFSNLNSLGDLCSKARAITEEAIGSNDPQDAEKQLGSEVFRKRAAKSRRLIRESAECEELWKNVLAEIGYPSQELYMDIMRLRVVPSLTESDTRMVRPLPPHRDTWGPNIPAQINWWLPIYPITAARTMVIWPDYFDKPIKNTCNDWDYDVLIKEKPEGYPLLPQALEQPESEGLPVVLNPGVLLAFSAAHFHASRRESGGAARFSMDTRTVWNNDVVEGRGAVNVDSGNKSPRWDMFERLGRSIKVEEKQQ